MSSLFWSNKYLKFLQYWMQLSTSYNNKLNLYNFMYCPVPGCWPEVNVKHMVGLETSPE